MSRNPVRELGDQARGSFMGGFWQEEAAKMLGEDWEKAGNWDDLGEG